MRPIRPRLVAIRELSDHNAKTVVQPRVVAPAPGEA